jgi:hypothetical protein
MMFVKGKTQRFLSPPARALQISVLIRTLFSVLLISLSVVIGTSAQSIEPLKVTAQFDVTSNTLVLKAPQSIRYRIDTLERRLRVLNAVLDEKSRAQLPDPAILKFSRIPWCSLLPIHLTLVLREMVKS